MSESARIADQLRRAFDGEAWHGDALFEILDGVTAKQAATGRIGDAHTIWELVLHIAAWDDAVRRRLGGVAVTLSGAENFPAVTDISEAAWDRTLADVRRVHEQLIATVAVFPDERLNEMVPGKEGAHYTFYYLLHGVVQHELYHGGQIALLKRSR
jgi:uncharacterized damage-inducible protein DinB